MADKGPKGDTFTYDMLTDEQKAELKGDAFTYADFTAEQLAALKGPKGDPFEYEDFTAEQLADLQGPKGDPFTYSDFTPAQLAALKGETGQGFVVKGRYDTLAALQSGVPSPDAGDAYSVGTAAPYVIYIYDGVNSAWVNHGQLQGAKGDPGKAFTYEDFTAEQLAALEGEDGFSPIVTISKTGLVTTVSIQDATGTKTATINDGSDAEIIVDDAISDTSVNPVQNKVIKAYIDSLLGDTESAIRDIDSILGGV